jgi:CIC family chloride channel protein
MVVGSPKQGIEALAAGGTVRLLSSPAFALLAVVLGLASGLGAVVFRGLIALVHNLLFNGTLSFLFDTSKHAPPSYLGYAVVIVPVIGAVLVTALVESFAPEAKGHGVPEVMDAIYYSRGAIRAVVAAVKALASAVSIGSGGSVGREGPIIQIGAASASWVGGWAHLPPWQRVTLVAAGGGAGIAATFNTPIGGVLFAVEILMHEVSVRTLVPVALATSVSTYVGRSFFGNHPAFDIPPFDFSTVSVGGLLLACVGLAFLLAGASAGFIKVLYASEDFFARTFKNPYLRHALGMLALGAIIVTLQRTLGHYYVEGVGYATILDALRGNLTSVATLICLWLLKLLATSLTLGSGASGGIFSPSLFMGATLGGAYGLLLARAFPHFAPAVPVLTLAGMAGLVAGATGASLTSIVMIFEMTLHYGVVLPMTVVVAVAYGSRRLLLKESIYTMKLARRGHFIPEALQTNLHWVQRIGDVMQPPTKVVPPEISPDRIRLDDDSVVGRPLVVARGPDVYGTIRPEWALSHRERVAAAKTAAELCTGRHIIATPEMTVLDLWVRFAETGADTAVVLGKSGSEGIDDRTVGVLGVVTKTDLAELIAKGMELY